MVGPDFQTPAANVAPKWLEWRARSLDAESEPAPAWWTQFRDPTLNTLIQTAYAQNMTLQSAGTRVLQARAELGIAIGELYPQSQLADGSINYNRASQKDPTATPDLKNYWRDTLGLRLAWELDFWGKFRRGVESADAAYLASIASYDVVLVELQGDIAATYIAIRTLEQQIAIAQRNVRRSREVLSIARDRQRGGASSELDVYQALNILGNAEASIPELTIQLRRGQNALRVLLGMEPQPLDALLRRNAALVPSGTHKVAIGIPADLLRRRPDVRAAEMKAAAQSAQVGVAVAALYPAISISGVFGGVSSNLNGASLGQVLSGAALTYSIGPSFQWNLLNYGQITNNVRLQDAKLQQLIIDYQQTVLKAQAEVENAIAAVTQSRAQTAALRRSYNAANRALQLAILEYQGGTRDFTTVLTAQQNLYAVEANLATANANVSQGLVALFRALGGGWRIREGKPFVSPANAQEMRERTNWGDLLTPQGGVDPPGPAPGERAPDIRPPEM